MNNGRNKDIEVFCFYETLMDAESMDSYFLVKCIFLSTTSQCFHSFAPHSLGSGASDEDFPDDKRKTI